MPEPPGRENGYRFPLAGQEKPPDGIARPCEGGDGGFAGAGKALAEAAFPERVSRALRPGA